MALSSRPLTAFDAGMAREVLKNEKTRTWILFWLFLFATTSNLTILLFPKESIKAVFGDMNFLLISLTMSSLIVYFFVMSRYLAHLVKKEKTMPFFIRYMNAFIEISIPLITGIIFAYSLPPANIEPTLTITVYPVYYFFIILSAMRMSFRICLFSGILGMAEFMWLYIQGIGLAGITGEQQVTMAVSNAIRLSAYILMTSVLAGIVTIDIRKRVNNALRQVEERNHIYNLFGQHVSPEVVDKLVRSPGQQGETRTVSVLFLDIRNFTKFSSDKSPAELVEYLNRLFGPMIEIIAARGGIINKFLGDGFLAVFGAPLAMDNSGLSAVLSAVEIIDDLGKRVRAGEIPETAVGIGIHTGEVLTGLVGSEKRKEYTIIGDTVNMASRIEGLNKQFRTSILISEETWLCVKDAVPQASFLDSVPVKGKDQPVRVYKV